MKVFYQGDMLARGTYFCRNYDCKGKIVVESDQKFDWACPYCGSKIIFSISDPDTLVPRQGNNGKGVSQTQEYLHCLFDGNDEYIAIYSCEGKVTGYNCSYRTCGETDCGPRKLYPIGGNLPGKKCAEASDSDNQADASPDSAHKYP